MVESCVLSLCSSRKLLIEFVSFLIPTIRESHSDLEKYQCLRYWFVHVLPAIILRYEAYSWLFNFHNCSCTVYEQYVFCNSLSILHVHDVFMVFHKHCILFSSPSTNKAIVELLTVVILLPTLTQWFVTWTTLTMLLFQNRIKTPLSALTMVSTQTHHSTRLCFTDHMTNRKSSTFDLLSPKQNQQLVSILTKPNHQSGKTQCRPSPPGQWPSLPSHTHWLGLSQLFFSPSPSPRR